MPPEIIIEGMDEVFDVLRRINGRDFTIQNLINTSVWGHRFSGNKYLGASEKEDFRAREVLEEKLCLMFDTHDPKKRVFIPGLNPLLTYERYLVVCGQSFMELGRYDSELSRTQKAIEVQKKILGKALELAGKVCFDYGSKTEEAEIEKVVGIDISSIYGRRDDLFVTYVKGNFPDLGKIASAKVTDATITDIAGKEYADNVLKYLGPGSADSGSLPESGQLLLDVRGILDMIGELNPKGILKSELRGYLYRKELGRVGIDINCRAEKIIVDSTNPEKATLYFSPRNIQEILRDRNILAIQFDKRYSDQSHAYVCSRKHLEDQLATAEQVKIIDPSYLLFPETFTFHGRTLG